MIDNTPTTASTVEEPRKDKKRAVIAFGLAALAIGGIGAAATSAAWTDNVFFSAGAEAATFNLQGSIDGKSWTEGVEEAKIEIPASELANLLPGETRTIKLHVKNDSTVGAALTSSVEFAASAFEENPTATVEDLAPTLVNGATDEFQLVVKAPADWAATNQGKSATIVVKIAGTATAVAG
ncbi:hypothetical protein ACQ143_00805 [Microbacterium sp. MC2]